MNFQLEHKSIKIYQNKTIAIFSLVILKTTTFETNRYPFSWMDGQTMDLQTYNSRVFHNNKRLRVVLLLLL